MLEHESALTGWIRDAQAILKGAGERHEEGGLAMLAAMLERGSASMLPACGMAKLVETATAEDGRDMATRAIGGDRLATMLPLDDEAAGILAGLIVRMVVCDVVMTAARLDTRTRFEPDLMEAIAIMATAVVTGAASLETIAGSVTRSTTA